MFTIFSLFSNMDRMNFVVIDIASYLVCAARSDVTDTVLLDTRMSVRKVYFLCFVFLLFMNSYLLIILRTSNMTPE